eukprot:m.16847 g.16847  ORF g.16847 m.16847 type:complete len:559 (+) comp5822_c0_seq1:191-1867(+)
MTTLTSRSRPCKGEEDKDNNLNESKIDMAPRVDETGFSSVEGDLTGDYHNIAVLLLLYTLQGVPMGFGAAIPLILKERGVSFTDLGMFSVCVLPFSAKLFWAPIVDSIYSKKIGRRKSWLVPMQLMIGITLFYVAFRMPDWLGEGDEGLKPQVLPLTMVFFFLYFCCATQDIAVDGWALTMLKKRNVGYASTVNTIGQTLGYMESFVLLMALVETNYVSFSTFAILHGIAFIGITLLVLFLKPEGKRSEEETVESAAHVYEQMAQVVDRPSVKYLLIVLLTWKLPSSVAETVTLLKLQEKGLPKEHAATLSLLLVPVSIFVPMFAAKVTSGTRPLDLAKYAYVGKFVVGFISGFILVYFAPEDIFKSHSDGESILGRIWPFYGLLLILMLTFSVFSTCLFVSQIAFFARISDPVIGGTYMTLLNTVANLGSLAAQMLVTYSIDLLTWNRCYVGEEDLGACVILSGDKNDKLCEHQGGQCTHVVDGYYVTLVLCFAFGIFWWIIFRNAFEKLQTRRIEDWRVVANKETSYKWLLIILSLVFVLMLPTLKKVFGVIMDMI